MGRPRLLDGTAAAELWPGSDYTPEELELLRAVDRYKSRTGKRFLSWREVLEILTSLGYAKCGTPPTAR